MQTTATPIAKAGFINAGESALFAWHHPACAETRRHAGIVLCPPLGYEYRSAYRTWRLLAERLAARGFDVLRFDYEGTGSSADGFDGDPSARIETWVLNVQQAMHELRALAVPRAISLVGLRLGAMLALQAASGRGDIDRLALWEAFPSGRACVREIRALARLSQQDHADEDSDPGYVNAAGYVIPRAMLDSLSQWTVSDLKTAPARDILLIDRRDRPAERVLADRLASLGVRLTSAQCEGTSEMLAPPHRAKVPEATLSTLVDWFESWHPAQISASPPASVRERELRGVHAAGGYSERPVRFGPAGRLFGMLAGPTLESTLPAIVLLTTGVEHQVGPHRLYVPLARQWAATGHTVLRYDVGGVGDSITPPGEPENSSYPPHMLDDLALAIAFVRRNVPNRPVIVAGLCSGGWASYLAAREGLPVEGIVSVNPPMYLSDPDAGAAWRAEIEELERYQQLRAHPAQWARKLRRPPRMRSVARLAALALRRGSAALFRRRKAAERDGLAADLADIARRDVKVLFVFSAHDKGLEYFQMFGAAALRTAHVHKHVQCVVVDGAGHSFRPRRAQETLRDLLIEFVNAHTVQPT